MLDVAGRFYLSNYHNKTMASIYGAPTRSNVIQKGLCVMRGVWEVESELREVFEIRGMTTARTVPPGLKPGGA
jgi:hypothetical protein